jgi:hypothetical protein
MGAAYVHYILNRGNMVKKQKTFHSYSDRKSGDTKFADPAEIKYQRPEDKPVDAKNSPWDFRCPQYDQRSSNFVNAGTVYGVGLRQPVGHTGPAKQEVDTLPCDRRKVQTQRVDEIG